MARRCLPSSRHDARPRANGPQALAFVRDHSVRLPLLLALRPPRLHIGPMRILLADIGGTHARFAWAITPGRHGPPMVLRVAEHASLASAMQIATGGERPDLALVALPGPVQGDLALLTNSPWGEIRAADLPATRTRLLNDLQAQAHLLPDHPARHLAGGDGDPAAPRLLANCGTGLGVALWVPGAGAIATEAGHASLAGATAEEDALIAALRARFGHASAERALCGPGLRTLQELVGDRAEALFLDLLAGHLGSLALATGARGGVTLAGNICNARAEALAAPAFHARFTAKGRFAPWLAALPLRLITLSEPGLAALAGLASACASTASRPAPPAPSGR